MGYRLAHNSITNSATSNEINMTSYNSLKVYVEITGTGIWRLDFLGSPINGGTFVSDGQSYKFSNSKSIVIPCVSDFIKIIATEISGTSTLTVKLQGFIGDASGVSNRVESTGLSTDTKPTNANPEDTFLELDTGLVFMFDGTTWWQM